eukprot:37854_1
MTLNEKIYQLLSWMFVPSNSRYNYGVGRLTQTGNTPQDIIQFRNKQQQMVINSSRLNIPASFHAESLHSCCAGGTIFPMPILQGCTWNNTLIEQIASIIALESRTVGTDVMYSPVINLWTDPRFGRIHESFSENPTLTAHYARAAVKGFQNDNAKGPFSYLANDKGISLAKHFAGYGAAIGGLNGAPADISLRTMFEIYLKPWRAFASIGGRGAMAAHETYNRVPMHANRQFVTDIFRNRFGFGDGQIVSDENNIGNIQGYNIAANKSQAAARAIRAGIDLDLIGQPPNESNYSGAYLQLQSAINSKWINESYIDLAAKRVLAGKFAVGLFDNMTYVNDINAWENILNCNSHKTLAYQAAVEGITILKVKKDLYSLKEMYENGKLNKIAFIGPNCDCNNAPQAYSWACEAVNICDTQSNMIGPYSCANGNVVEILTLLQAFKQSNKYNKTIKFTYNKGVAIQTHNTSGITAAINAAKLSDATIVVLGDSIYTCGEERDNDNLNPPGKQFDLLSEVVTALNNTNIPIILVLINGRPYTFTDGYDPSNTILNNIDLLINAYRPGQMGGIALRDILMGDVENSGRLAQNWPKIVGDVRSGSSPWLQEIRGEWAINYGKTYHDMDGRAYLTYQNEYSYFGQETTPLFELGYGLSNTGCTFKFEYSNLRGKVVNKSTVQSDDSIVMTVMVDVINKCKVTATDVFQVYLIDPPMLNMDMDYPILTRYWKRLIGFKKFTLDSAQSTTLSIDIRFDDIAIY